VERRPAGCTLASALTHVRRRVDQWARRYGPPDAAPIAIPDRLSHPLTRWEGAAPPGPLSFECTLAACIDLAVAGKQRAYELSRAVLADSPDGLATERSRLVAAIARVGADQELTVAVRFELSRLPLRRVNGSPPVVRLLRRCATRRAVIGDWSRKRRICAFRHTLT
jgi:hypothetical protein